MSKKSSIYLMNVNFSTYDLDKWNIYNHLLLYIVWCHWKRSSKYLKVQMEHWFYHHHGYLLKYVVLHQKIHLVLGLLLKIVWTLFVIERISQSVKNKHSSISQISLSVFAFFEKNNSVDHKNCEVDNKIHWA